LVRWGQAGAPGEGGSLLWLIYVQAVHTAIRRQFRLTPRIPDTPNLPKPHQLSAHFLFTNRDRTILNSARNTFFSVCHNRCNQKRYSV
jgi:hypothetical protein